MGRNGSGTIFLAGCNLPCAYCQNWEIRHGGAAGWASGRALERMMPRLQSVGWHNINLVTAAHFLPNIEQALCSAVAGGIARALGVRHPRLRFGGGAGWYGASTAGF